MKKAYIVIAHKNPGQIHRLVSRLNDGNSSFFIHIDRKIEIAQFKILDEFSPNLEFVDRFDSKWGHYGTIKPYLNALKRIQESNKHYDRVMLLSGQDYPIKSNEDIDDFFANSDHSVFIDYFPIPNHEKWPGTDRGGLYRIDKYYFGAAWYELFFSRSANFLAKYLPFLRRRIPYGMKPYTGQTWWNLDMNVVNYILSFHESHPEYLKYHKHTFVADELFVQMIIGNSQDEKLLNSVENTEKRFTLWEKPTSAHPKILLKSDFDLIAKSNDLFARKFDADVDSEILDLIDTKILNFKPVS